MSLVNGFSDTIRMNEWVISRMIRTAEDQEGCKSSRSMASPGHIWQTLVRLAGLSRKVRAAQ